MVKGVARSAASSSQQPPAPQALPTMQTGQNPHDPLTQLNSHMGFGAMADLNPFAEMGLNPNDPNLVCLFQILWILKANLPNSSSR
jgi:ubiquilin